MDQNPTDIQLNEWIKSVFDHPVADPAWYWSVEPNSQQDDETPSITVRYVTRLFMNSREFLGQYSDDQVNQGLWYLVNPACSNIMRDALDVGVPLLERLKCIHSILVLFRDCFATRCSNDLSHRDQPSANPANLACYMWWDVFPASGQIQEYQAILDVMRDTLALPSDACRESALHGLGHWQSAFPEQVKQIIKEFLAKTPDLSKPLRQYALKARAGNVL